MKDEHPVREGQEDEIQTHMRAAPDVPGDLPEHSLVSYNPNRTRFVSPSFRPGDAPPDDTTNPQFNPTVLPPAEHIPDDQSERHRLVRLIGRGGCGEVWEAVQIQLDRPVAVKRLRDDRFGSGRGDHATPEMIQYFREEALVAARLDHPNIVPVYDYSVSADGTPELSMKLVRGRPWDKILREEREKKSFDDYLPHHLSILAAVANSVAFAHSRNIVHRDIKPSQVMVGEYGEVLLMDWGLAVIFEREERPKEHYSLMPPEAYAVPTLATAASPAGTPAYMAPEQTLPTAGLVGPWTDIYLLGGCLYCILTGLPPYEDSSSHEAFVRAAEGRIRDPRVVVGEGIVPDALAELAMSALKREPRERIVTAELFVEKLEEWISGASRRRESEVLTDALEKEFSAEHDDYSAHVAFIDRIQHAAGLWNGNPAIPELREKAITAYAELALERGDLLLAKSQATLLPAGPGKAELVQRVEAARLQRARTRRALRMSVVAVAVLVATLIVGGFLSFSRIDKERIEAIAQKNVATVAQAAAERAREVATSEQLYAQVRYATSLVDAGRHVLARDVLWTIPEDQRSWEWAWLISRAYQPMAEFPFATRETSTEANWLFVDGADGAIEVRESLAGSLVAKLDHETTDVMLLIPPKDAYVDTLEGGTTYRRWSPPEWEPRVMATFPKRATLANTQPLENLLIVAFDDNSARVYDRETMEERFVLPPMPEPIIAIDYYAPRDAALFATGERYRVARLSDGSTISQGLLFTTYRDIRLAANARYLIARRHDYTDQIDLGTGIATRVSTGASQIVAHSASDRMVHMPHLFRVGKDYVDGELPVASSVTAMARFLSPEVLLYWNGTNGEVGAFWAPSNRIAAELQGLLYPVVDMWGSLSGPSIDRLVTTTSDNSTQVWLSSRYKFIAVLPGQWSSFRSDGQTAVSIMHHSAAIAPLTVGADPVEVGSYFSIYRSIATNPDETRAYAFGYGASTDGRFGWEAKDTKADRPICFAAAGKEPSKLPYRWVNNPSMTRTAILPTAESPGEIWSTDECRQIGTFDAAESSVTVLSATNRDTMLVGDVLGIIREISILDGSLIRTLDTGTPIWALMPDYKNDRIVVSGDDYKLRCYEWSEGEPKLLFTTPATTTPTVTGGFGADGKLLVTVSYDNREVTVRNIPDGTERIHFSIDVPQYQFRLNREGTRIFGLGPEGLMIWDMQGREVGRIANVVDIAMDGRRLIIASADGSGAHDQVIELPPYRTEDLPGDATLSVQDRYALWRQGEYRDWWIRHATRHVPSNMARLRAELEGTVSENGKSFREGFLTAIGPLGVEAFRNPQSLIRLAKADAAIISAGDPDNLDEIEYALWGQMSSARIPGAQEVLDGLQPYSLLGAALELKSRVTNGTDEYSYSVPRLVSRLNMLGRTTEADLLARHHWATMMAVRGAVPPTEQDECLPYPSNLPPAPPADIAIVSDKAWNSRRTTQELFDAFTALPVTEAFRELRGDRIMRDRAILFEWINSTVPPPDYEALLAEARALLPEPPTPDTLLKTLVGTALDDFERGLLDGLTPAEARAAAALQFDQAVEAARRERELGGER